MPSIWHYEGKVQFPTEAQFPASIIEEWAATLKAENARILASLNTKIIQPDAFDTVIAAASSEAYDAFLSETGAAWDIDWIKLKQKIKLLKSKDQWLAGVEACFSTGGYFQSIVEAKKNKMKKARYTLGAVGFKPDTLLPYGVWNPVTMSMLCFRGDTRALRYMVQPTREVFTGALEAALDPKKGAYVSPSCIADGVQACVMARYADELNTGEGDTLRDLILSQATTRILAYLNLAKKSGAVVDYSLAWVEPKVLVTAEYTSQA